jgi:methionine aminopeptidase, type I
MNRRLHSFRRQEDALPAAIAEKIQFYKRKGYRVPPRQIIRTNEQIKGIRASAQVNTALLDYLTEYVKEGVSTAELDRLAYQFTVEHGAIPAPLNYEGFPKSVCISINDVVCHGIPSDEVILRNGDIVNIDVSTILNGYYSDASRMFMIGEVSEEKRRLVQVTKECMEIGIATAQPWARLGDVGAAIQEHAEKNGYTVVRELCGHGVGIHFHEQPTVEHYGRPGTGMLIVPGMTFTIEPMINMGRRNIFIDQQDGWTVYTSDGAPSAQWENMLLITENGNEILTY